jgi:hypothetical protein
VVAEILLLHSLNILGREVVDVHKVFVDKIHELLHIGIAPLLWFGGCHEWHLAEMGRASYACAVVAGGVKMTILQIKIQMMVSLVSQIDLAQIWPNFCN